MAVQHTPVLVDAVLRWLEPQRGGVFADCTVGLGGHAEAVLRAGHEATVVGIDRDPQALEMAAERLRPFGARVRLLQGSFLELRKLLGGIGIERVAGVLADLGVSSLQLETAERGFSFRLEGPLDMRMGPGPVTAEDIVNRYSEGELVRIFQEYGEERQARRIARAIVEARQRRYLKTTRELADLIHEVKGRPSPRSRRIDPATRVFQALRIAVNGELSGLDGFLEDAVDLLEKDGRLVVISYHSLEDRIVKRSLRDMARGQVDDVTGRPLWETQLIEVLTHKPLRPSPEEVALNPRSRSARLRAARRLPSS